jgi:hypothetical protein
LTSLIDHAGCFLLVVPAFFIAFLLRLAAAVISLATVKSLMKRYFEHPAAYDYFRHPFLPSGIFYTSGKFLGSM